MRPVRPTPPTIVARYAHPPADTPYSLEYAYHLLGDVAGATVLDLGCGEGRDATLIARRGARVYGVDISEDLLRIAGQRAAANGQQGAIEFRCGSTHRIPLPDESIDVVFGNAILHHVDLTRTASEVRRVLRPGGRAIFKEPIRESRTLAAIRPLVPYRHANVSPFERPLTREQIRSFASGFQALRYRVFELPHVRVLRVLGLGDRLMATVRRQDRNVLRRFPRLERYGTIVVFEVTK